MGNFDIGYFILFMVGLIFSLSVHEFGHAWVSLKFGDDLAYSQGRVTLNPLAHIDPIGTLLIPAIGFLGLFSFSMIGWARPVPVNPLRWRNKRVANFWVSSAGIIGNLGIAVVAAILIRIIIFNFATLRQYEATNSVIVFLDILFRLNIGLFVFNLLPIPPLDGGAIFSSIFPPLEDALDAIGMYGVIVLIIFVNTPLFGMILGAVLSVAYQVAFYGTPFASRFLL
jgi:Zn-dependent protease